MFTIDGMSWDIPCTIERTAEMTASDISGVLLDRTYFNDVLGTYMSYDVSVAVPVGQEWRYSTLYDILTDPMDGHVMTLPYDDGEIEITGRIETVSDTLVRIGGINHWRNTKFRCIANHPSRQYTLDEVVTRGMTLVPHPRELAEGDMYVWQSGEWMQVHYEDVDERYY